MSTEKIMWSFHHNVYPYICKKNLPVYNCV